MARIPLSVAQRPLEVGPMVDYSGVGNSPIGRAMSGLGEQIGAVAERIQQRQETEDRFTASILESEFDARLEGMTSELAREAPANGKGLHDAAVGTVDPRTGKAKPGLFDTVAKEYAERMPASQRDRFQARLPERRLRVANRMATVQYTQEQKWYQVETDRVQGDLVNKILALDPEDKAGFDDFKQQGREIVLNSGLPDLDKQVALESWDEQTAEAFFQAKLAKDPQFAAEAPALLGLARTDDAFEGRLVSRESGGRADVINPWGYAGLYQFGAPRLAELGLYRTGENLSGWSKRRGSSGKWTGQFNIPGFPEVRTLPDFLRNPAAQKAAYQAHIASFDRAIGERGLDQYIGQTIGGVQITRQGIHAMMHLGGEAGAARTLKSGGASNPSDANDTSLLDYAKMGAATDATFDSIPPDRRLALARQAEAQANRNMAEYTAGAEDYVSFLRDGGKQSEIGRYSPADVSVNLPQAQAAMLQEQFSAAEAYGRDKLAIQYASPREVQSIIAQRAQLLDNPEGYRANVQNLAGLQSTLEARNKAMLADPAAYVAQQPGIAASFQAMRSSPSDAGVSRQYATAVLAEQARLGIAPEDRRILPNTVSAEIVGRFNEQREGGQNAAALMRSLEQQWGAAWPQVFAELAATKQLPGTAMVVGTMNRPEQIRPAEALAEAAKIGTSDLEASVTKAAKREIEEDLDSQMEDFGRTLVNNGQSGVSTYLNFREAVYQLALSYSRSEDPSQALERAYTDVLGRAYSFSDTFRVPIDYDASQIVANTDDILERLSGEGLRLPVSGLDDEQTRQAYVRQVQANGFWVTNGDETGLTLFDETGTAVTMVDGRPLSFTWDEILGRAESASEPSTDLPPILVRPEPVFQPEDAERQFIEQRSGQFGVMGGGSSFEPETASDGVRRSRGELFDRARQPGGVLEGR